MLKVGELCLDHLLKAILDPAISNFFRTNQTTMWVGEGRGQVYLSFFQDYKLYPYPRPKYSVLLFLLISPFLSQYLFKPFFV